jgi:hypothetical protein
MMSIRVPDLPTILDVFPWATHLDLWELEELAEQLYEVADDDSAAVADTVTTWRTTAHTHRDHPETKPHRDRIIPPSMVEDPRDQSYLTEWERTYLARLGMQVGSDTEEGRLRKFWTQFRDLYQALTPHQRALLDTDADIPEEWLR